MCLKIDETLGEYLQKKTGVVDFFKDSFQQHMQALDGTYLS